MHYFPVKMTALAAVAALSLGTAKAAIITATYTVVGSNFSTTGPVPPYASIIESFTVTFNTTASTAETTTGISFNGASTITPTSPVSFSRIYIPGFTDTLIVGGSAGTATSSDPNSTDFAVNISNPSDPANFSITSLTYSVGNGAVFTATTRTSGTPPTAVPEPASLALFGGAAALLAFVRRRRARH